MPSWANTAVTSAMLTLIKKNNALIVTAQHGYSIKIINTFEFLKLGTLAYNQPLTVASLTQLYRHSHVWASHPTERALRWGGKKWKSSWKEDQRRTQLPLVLAGGAFHLWRLAIDATFLCGVKVKQETQVTQA